MKFSYIKRILILLLGLFTIVVLVLGIFYYSKKATSDDNSVALYTISDVEPTKSANLDDNLQKVTGAIDEVTPEAADDNETADNNTELNVADDTNLDSNGTYIDEDNSNAADMAHPTGDINILERVKGLPTGDLAYGTEAHGLYPQNANVMVDLNGDGTMESICYIAGEIWANSALVINNVDYSAVVNEHYEDSPDQSYFFIGDIDPSDSFIEIGLPAYGSSSDDTTSFFQYDGNELNYLGCVPGLPIQFEEAGGGGSVELTGDGNLTTSFYRLDVIQTWFCPVTYTLNKGVLSLVEQDIYYPYTYESDEYPIRLLCLLPVYKEPFDEAASTTLMNPQVVKLTATDNKNWCKIEGADGTVGWFYFTDYGYIPSLQKNVSEVIENLSYAD